MLQPQQAVQATSQIRTSTISQPSVGTLAPSLAQNQSGAVTLATGLNAQQLQLLQQQLQGIQVVSVSTHCNKACSFPLFSYCPP